MTNKIIAITAFDDDYVIGHNNELPAWKCPEDMKFFREMTDGKPLLMGRKTAESFKNGPLKGRTNFVLSKMWPKLKPGFVIIDDPRFAIAAARQEKKDLVVIGGAQIYQLMAPYIDELYATLIPGQFEGDTHFPVEAFRLGDDFTSEVHKALTPDVVVVRYERKK